MSQTFRLGAFIVVTLAILAAGVFLVGNKESKFQSNYRIKTEFQNVAGLNEGADVRIGGIHKGSVRKLILPKRPDGKVTVIIDLAKETRDVVRQDSIASIKSEGLLGDKYVEVSFGSDQAGPIKSGDTIGSEPPLDISDMVSKTNQILDTAKTALQNVQGATENIDAITGKINQGRGTVGALVNDKAMYRQATAGVTALNEDAEALKHNFLLRGFFNNRGYDDSAAVKKNKIAQIPSGTPQQSFDYDAKKIFDKPDTAKLKNQKSLNEAGQYLQTQKFGLAVIAAYTDMKGDSDKDRALTEARAYVIRKYLVDSFKLDDQRIKTIGLGKTDTPADQVKIVIFPPSGTQSTQPQTEPRERD